jgi:hypothetical protein
MVALHVALHDGFEDDEVEVRVDGVARWHHDAVRTRTQISLAETLELEVAGGRHEIVVDVTSRGTSGRLEIDVDEPTWLAASLDLDGTVQFRRSGEPFGYV